MLVLTLRTDEDVVMRVGGTELVRVRFFGSSHGKTRVGLIAGSEVIITREKEEEENNDSRISNEE